jgi:peptide/nickel transport system substrate-binding protein
MLKRPKQRILMLSLSFLSLLILLLSACGAPTQGTSSGGGTTGTAVKGGTWIDDLYEEPDSLIPNASTETFADMVDQAIYAPLFYGDSQGHVHAGLVTEIPTVQNGGISPDLKTWTFHLRSGLKWSDGQPLDARDVDFTWKVWDNPKFGAASTVGFNLIQSATVSPDNLSITFHLSKPFAPFVSIWTDGLNAPMPAHRFASVAVDQITKTPDNLNPQVVSGPFMMKESKPGDHYTVVRNPNFYMASQGYPYLDSVVFRIVTDQNTILKDLQAGSIDSAWFLDVSKTPAYKRLTDYQLLANKTPANFEATYFNFKNKILANNPDVRKAMAMAIDHQALINVARRGQALPLCTDHGPGLVPGYQPNAPCPSFDPKAANALLDQDGWTKGSDGIRSKNGQRLSFMYSTTANNVWRADDELILQQDFKAIGIQINIQNYPASTFFGTFLGDGIPGKDDIFEFENTFTYDADDASVAACNQAPPNGENFMFYCNKQLDALYSQEEATADPNQRQQVFDQIHQIYLTDFPFIVLYGPEDIAMVKNGTHNYAPGPMGASETVNIWQWWCDGGKCPA